MKKKIYAGLSILLCIFIGGSLFAVRYITKTTHHMDNLILLHQVEILREDLIIRVQQVQSQLYRNRTRSSNDVEAMIAQVEEMDRVVDQCVGCHHSPELAQGILGMRDMANDYKTAISHLITASANPQRILFLERRAQDLGQELITMTQGMAFTANVQLQQRTQATMATIREVRNVLFLTIALGFLLAVGIAVILSKGLDRHLRQLLDAARHISHGELLHQVNITGARGNEFMELGEAFNTMIRNLHLSQRQLVQRAKLTAIGEMATNIAYEINNPLTGVLGYTGLLLKADDITAEKKEHLRIIERETLHARDILKKLLDFSRRKPPQLVKTDISEMIREAISLVKGHAGTDTVAISTVFPSGLPLAAVDPGEIKQVFVNLISNAFFAMPRGGALTIHCREGRDFSGKKSITVEIADTGDGIPEERLDKIFDPFFTTRPDGEGMGLGLSISYMIVQDHEGSIEVESRIGEGSTFRVILPVREL